MTECAVHNFLFSGSFGAFEGTQTEVEVFRSWHAVVTEAHVQNKKKRKEKAKEVAKVVGII